MYAQYKSLCSQKLNPSKIQKFVEDANTDEVSFLSLFVQVFIIFFINLFKALLLIKFFIDFLKLCEMVIKVLSSSEITQMLDHLLQGLSGSEKCHNKRQKLIKTIFDGLCKAKVNTKHVDNIVNRIVVEFSSFDRIHLVKLVDYFVERIRKNDDDFMRLFDINIQILVFFSSS